MNFFKKSIPNAVIYFAQKLYTGNSLLRNLILVSGSTGFRAAVGALRDDAN